MNREPSDNVSKPWLSIIGIGENGLDGLSVAARQALDQAVLVWGGRRHLDLACVEQPRARAWPSPISEAYPIIQQHRGDRVAVLASGDPFHYGVGSEITRHVEPKEMTIYPVAGSVSLACARMGWAEQDIEVMTVHGRALERLRPHLQPNAKLLVLSWDQTTPAKLAAYLAAHDFGDSRLCVLEALGGPRERVRNFKCTDVFPSDIYALNIIALDCVMDVNARPIPLSTGLEDGLFDHDGQITKSQIRALTLQALAPHPGEFLLDIGTGSGSVAIEWLLRAPSMRAVGIEKNPQRATRARANALALGVPQLDIVEGVAPEALTGLPTPDAVFVGGGATVDGMVDTVLKLVRPGGRVVMNAVTLETESVLASLHKTHGGALTRMSIAHADAIGDFRGWRSQMPVTQWRWVRS